MMTDSRYKLIPLQKTQSIPVHWEFSQDDYDKLTKGHRSNWCIFLRDDVVHVCTIPGEELYRFAVSKTDDGHYTTDSLEAYISDDFYESAKWHRWSEAKIEQHQAVSRQSAVEETAGLLVNYLDIKLKA